MLNKLMVMLDERVKNFGAPYFAFGLYGIINYLSFYPWWVWQYKVLHDPSLIRHIFSLLICILLVFHKKWPETLKRYQALYLYFCIFFTMPFSNTIFFLAAPTHTTTLLNSMFVIFVLILVVDWLSFAILLILGVTLGFLDYTMYYGLPHITFDSLATPLFTFTWTIFTGILLSHSASRQRKNLQLEKQLSAIKAVVASIAHELRTPLLSIRAGAAGIKNFIPKLMQGYRAAESANLTVSKIYEGELKHIERVIDNIDSEVNYSNNVIDSLLTNASKEIINPEVFSKHSIVSCIQAALIRFPFNPKEQIQLVHFDKEKDFNFHGDDLLVIHIIFNLMKNAFYAIAEAGKGEVYIQTELGEKYNTLYFKDTAKGLTEEEQKKIFAIFYTNTPNNTGMGLAYCRLAMESFNGNITVRSIRGKYTEFVLKFPAKIPKLKHTDF